MAARSRSPYKPCLLSDIQRLIDRDPNLARYNILSLHSFIMPWATAISRGTVPHRFLLLELGLDDERLWLKLERRPDSKIALVRGFGTTDAKDEVGSELINDCTWWNMLILVPQGQFFEHRRNILLKNGYRRENEHQLAYPHPTLRDLGIVIGVISGPHSRYTLFKVCCISSG